MSNVFIKQSDRNTLARAPVRQFTGQQMPPEMAAVHAFHLQKPESVKEDTKQAGSLAMRKTQLPLRANAMSGATNMLPGGNRPGQSTVGQESVPALRTENHRKIHYTKLKDAVKPSDYEDVGSQTDHSDVSDGVYSDETTEERLHREHNVQQKKQKRLRRIRSINEKHGILENC